MGKNIRVRCLMEQQINLWNRNILQKAQKKLQSFAYLCIEKEDALGIR